MPRAIAFLRAINVGGHTVAMERLRALFQELGFGNVETFIASGNVIFDSKTSLSRALETKIETHLEQALQYRVATFLRSPEQLQASAQFAQTLPPAKALYVGFLHQPLSPEAANPLLALQSEQDAFYLREREIYWLAQKTQGESKFSNRVCEKAIHAEITFRNVTTLLKLAAKYPPR